MQRVGARVVVWACQALSGGGGGGRSGGDVDFSCSEIKHRVMTGEAGSLSQGIAFM